MSESLRMSTPGWTSRSRPTWTSIWVPLKSALAPLKASPASSERNIGTDTFTCTSTTGCNLQTDTTNDYDDIAFGLIVARMQLIYNKIQPENVVVEYRHIGLGDTLTFTVRHEEVHFGQ